MKVRVREPADIVKVQAFLTEHGSERVARLGELLDPLEHPALVAEEHGRLMGVLTYVIHKRDCEVLTLHAGARRQGTGTALTEAVQRIASEQGCDRLFLVTTNDNVDALRFYQRRGFVLAALHRGAVDDSRVRLKPEIPDIGDYGIPLRDEIVLEKPVARLAGHPLDG